MIAERSPRLVTQRNSARRTLICRSAALFLLFASSLPAAFSGTLAERKQAARSEFEAAEGQLRSALDLDPRLIASKQSLVNVYIRERKFEQAETLLKQMISEEKNSAQSRFALATFYLSQKRAGEAAKIDSELAHDAPNFVPARLQLAEIAMQANKLDQADSVIVAILKDRPKEPQALIFHGKILLQQKQPVKAIAELEAAQQLEPNSALLHYLLGVAYAQNANLERARGSFEAGMELARAVASLASTRYPGLMGVS